jgi:hypothetical protein
MTSTQNSSAWYETRRPSLLLLFAPLYLHKTVSVSASVQAFTSVAIHLSVPLSFYFRLTCSKKQTSSYRVSTTYCQDCQSVAGSEQSEFSKNFVLVFSANERERSGWSHVVRIRVCQMANFRTKNPNFGYILEGLAMEVVDIFYGWLVYFKAIKIFYGNLRYFSTFWYVVPRKIWQPWSGSEALTGWAHQLVATCGKFERRLLCEPEACFLKRIFAPTGKVRAYGKISCLR